MNVLYFIQFSLLLLQMQLMFLKSYFNFKLKNCHPLNSVRYSVLPVKRNMFSQRVNLDRIFLIIDFSVFILRFFCPRISRICTDTQYPDNLWMIGTDSSGGYPSKAFGGGSLGCLEIPNASPMARGYRSRTGAGNGRDDQFGRLQSGRLHQLSLIAGIPELLMKHPGCFRDALIFQRRPGRASLQGISALIQRPLLQYMVCPGKR